MKTLQERIAEEGRLFSDFSIEFRIHASKRMFQRAIKQEDVEYVLLHGAIIEEYQDDFPLPSVLINGRIPKGKQLHVVAGINAVESIIVVITTYEPDPNLWSEGYSRRIT